MNKLNGITLKVPSSLELLSLIRSTVKNYLEISDVEQKFIYQLLSVVDELATNAIEHGYNYSAEKNLFVTVRLDVQGDEVVIEVEDFGEGFKGEGHSKEEGGMGLNIVRGMVDRFEMIEKEKGLTIKVYKRIEEGIK